MSYFPLRRVILFLGTAVVATVLGFWFHQQEERLERSAYSSGYVLLGLVLFLWSLHARKKVLFLPLGPASLWLQGHIYVGFLAMFICGVHVGWRWPNGWMESALFVAFGLTSLSGVCGLIWSRRLPRRLTKLREQVIYERIPGLRYQLRAMAARSADELSVRFPQSALRDFYSLSLEPYLAAAVPMRQFVWCTGRRRNRLRAELEGLSRYCSPEERELQARWARWIDQRDDLDYHTVQQGRFEGLALRAPGSDLCLVGPDCRTCRFDAYLSRDVRDYLMDESLQRYDTGGYPRPEQRWICGDSRIGRPCPWGPGPGGVCHTTADCVPVLRGGDCWECHRSPLQGGKCEPGPGPNGECGMPRQKCRPILSLRAWRGRFVGATTAIALISVGVTLRLPERHSILAPGPLIEPHAQLLNRQGEQRCQACHERGAQGFSDWIAALVQPTPTGGQRQSDLCLVCHGQHMPRQHARDPHHLDPRELARHTMVAVARHRQAMQTRKHPGTPSGELACATCHREHHGPHADLSAVSDQQCQTCHQLQFRSFSQGHPEFVDWPYRRRTRIIFDHHSHALRYFAEKNRTFHCQDCHTLQPSGEMSSVNSYDVCAVCHDPTISQSAELGIDILALPMLDIQFLRDAGFDIGDWPAWATGDFDGPIPAVMQQLLCADPETEQALQTLGPQFNFLDLDLDDPAQVEAAAQVALGMKRLFANAVFAETDAKPTRSDLSRVDAAERSEVQGFHLLGAEGIQALRWAGTSWFKDLDRFRHVESEPNRNSVEEPHVQAPRVPWQVRLETGQVRYFPIGHADSLVKQWLDEVARQARGEWDRLPPALFGESSPGQCTSCHSVEVDKLGALKVQWRGKPLQSGTRFTRFSHKPHLALPVFQDCTACHGLRSHAETRKTYQQEHATLFDPGFQPLERSKCAECHTSRAVGDSCVKCHAYHVHASAEIPSWARVSETTRPLSGGN